ncbi:Protoporphyrinogen oxidase 2, chloroplastic/mitochondrial [Arabidopsis thaliana]|uniref:Protoporphyrinogen oxidase 2, chloroplastic/mitochondrial n=7 Tax=Arabidopsis TaxID=3701 RepID=PPOCM_ARATH|nr:Flavin containing amine oxidoreductase family [Arabidopsis thaliana]Q8S9J1.1 RecName: Full=Protoporphyrinogen oxidase 2, chloroplastic/mitochondrial; Short=PPO2; AltName: Full=Protein MATERNAL EFFECT EMBRYO ARREST 61; Flags: Precursor [Arabidopsis thaliana]KAG7602211.1 FAD/NAD(P)-binding domain superfamily [Arabidopsis thaliana x Arabidopsis arenosa]KAG7609158.1 FAD/NAD(P)-binding domain superfamily [Arabidopsis suecica]AAL77672.1 AT5g14220/MUA22_22 [Arabidopsis thaliana]AAM26644.1 AT5g1422|eukprot:NP_196926.2 Flavin containing amine oxidoreductase family [Arabidopsis thaliana]
MASGAVADHQIEAVSGKRVAVVGAGVSGLAAAYKLKSRGLNVTVFEADGRVGGKLRSVMQNGLIWDEGANTMTEAEPEVGSLLDDLGLREKQQFPISQKKRYIVRNGVPVMLPTNPIELVTSSVLSTQSKFQILLEPFLWKKKSSKVSDASAEESVSEFFQRHFGQEVVDYLIDPFVGGTSAADPDSLSMKHSFPDLWNVEKSFGSIIVGAIRTKFAAKGGKSRDTKSSPGTKKGSRGSFSFKGGMQILPDTLCKSLSHDEINLDSKVLSLSYNSGSRQENWSLSCVSHNETQRQNPHYDAVIMTAPLCNVKEMKVMKGGQPFQLNFLPEINYMPLSVLITTFTKEKVKRPLEGFGVLIPSKEQKHGFKTLGTLFSSMMFPDRSPSDVHLYTTFIGGSRNQELAKASTDELKQVVTSDLQRLLGVEGEPVSVNHYYWRKAFPLYDSSYDSVMEAIDKMENDLPGFFYAGNHRGGLSVGKSIASGCKAADLVISYLESCSNDKKPNDSL